MKPEASMQILPENTEFGRSHKVAKMIAAAAPSALFCTFTVTNGRKIPHNKRGTGVSELTPKEHLYTADEVLSMPTPQTYMGLCMHRPITDRDDVLFVLDVDTKHSESPTDIAIQSLGKRAKDHELLTERSISTRGRHVFGFARPDDSILPKYNLGNRQEVEVFGMPKSPKKSLLLTGDMLTMDYLGGNPVNLKDLLDEVGIIKRHFDAFPKPATPVAPRPSTNPDEDYRRAQEALHCIDADVDYNDWIMVGQALQAGLGEAGFSLWDEWSSAGGKYSGTNDLEYHWRTFKPAKGVNIGSMFHLAKTYGYKPPTSSTKALSAVEAFQIPATPIQPATPAPDAQLVEDSQPPPPTTTLDGWPEHRLDLTKLQPVDYLVDGFLAHSLMILAGMPAVGKTSGLISMAMIIAGFSIPGSDLKTKNPRKIIYVTEDMHQVQTILFAMCKHFQLPTDQVADKFVMLESKRSTVPELLTLAHNVARHTVNDTRPFLILDTANATMAMENENDNSEAGTFIAAIKQTIYTQMRTPVAIIAHTPKGFNKSDEDASARGASAFVGDVTLTSVMYVDASDNRVIKLQKTRYEPQFREIVFESVTIDEPVIDPHGDIQTVRCRVSIPKSLSDTQKMSMQQQRQLDQDNDKIDKACLYIQETINRHGPIAIKMGSGGAKSPPQEIASLHRLVWADVYANVPGTSKSSDTRRAVRNAAYERFAMTPFDGWCRLSSAMGGESGV